MLSEKEAFDCDYLSAIAFMPSAITSELASVPCPADLMALAQSLASPEKDGAITAFIMPRGDKFTARLVLASYGSMDCPHALPSVAACEKWIAMSVPGDMAVSKTFVLSE